MRVPLIYYHRIVVIPYALYGRLAHNLTWIHILLLVKFVCLIILYWTVCNFFLSVQPISAKS